MRSAVGRADLARFVADLPPDRVARAAALLGFDAPILRGEVSVPPPAAVDPPEVVAPEELADAQRAIEANAAPVPLWRLEAMTFTDEPEPPAVAPAPEPGLTEADLRSPDRSLLATPPSPPLTPWARLWPALHAALRTTMLGREPDVLALLRSLSRGDIVDRIPRKTRRAWSGRASVWVDRSERLVPFWSDQADVCRRLVKICGRSGFDVRVLGARAQARALARRRDFLADFRPNPATPVLVLGDLGAFGSRADRVAWLSTARRLHHAGVRMTALVPSPPARWDPAVARAWSAISWERGRQRCGVLATRAPEVLQERAERLLRLASPAAYVQPGLLRALRMLLPAWQADAATEVDVWGHSDVRAADSDGMVLHPEAAARWRERFASEVDPSLQSQVSGLLRQWHAGLPAELLRGETLAWLGLRQDSTAAPPGNSADALAFARRMEATARRGDPTFSPVLTRYGRALLSSMPASVYEAVPSLKIVWAASFKGVHEARVPRGIDPGALYSELGRGGEPRMWGIRQVGRDLVFSPLRSSGAWPSDAAGPGSPIAWLAAARPYLWVTRGRENASTQLLLQSSLCRISLEPGEGVMLRTDGSEVTLYPWTPEPWAAASGRDRFGLWADAHICGVVQRFRWIPPGRFRMGSPEDEAGRWKDEGPQHTVTWTRGMWIADTPVTQALWDAVMNDNPSQFKSPDRPVEQVSWYDCQFFLKQLNARVSSLEARLPTEAEWEYACRAGTETATWLGDLLLRDESTRPPLSSIAWYAGNIGGDPELGEGWASSERYALRLPGTQPVGTRSPNPLGLYDMLGNVFEWCMDSWGTYEAGDRIDPRANESVSSRGVLRGGSWRSNARYIRAALRLGGVSEHRVEALGFRLARGVAPRGPSGGAARGALSGPEARGAGPRKKQ